MPTREGISLANVKGLDLVLVDYNTEPPVCQLTKEGVTEESGVTLDDTEGFSFDPTLRPAIIQVSSTIEAAELDRKVDILRKHLLEKKRCEIVVTNRDDRSSAQEIHDLVGKLLVEVQDIAKSPDIYDLEIRDQKLSVRVWPCNAEQTQSADWSLVEIEDGDGSTSALGNKGDPRKFRHIRRRVDPKLFSSSKHSKLGDDE